LFAEYSIGMLRFYYLALSLPAALFSLKHSVWKCSGGNKLTYVSGVQEITVVEK
jgi:hypothetical protein